MAKYTPNYNSCNGRTPSYVYVYLCIDSALYIVCSYGMCILCAAKLLAKLNKSHDLILECKANGNNCYGG